MVSPVLYVGNHIQSVRRDANLILGDSGLDGTDLLPEPAKPAIVDNKYITAMRDALLAEPKNTAWVVATGTYTNIGLLFASYPEVAEHIAGLSLMGGAVGNGFTEVPISLLAGHEKRVGNWTEFAEFNVYVSLPPYSWFTPFFDENMDKADLTLG